MAGLQWQAVQRLLGFPQTIEEWNRDVHLCVDENVLGFIYSQDGEDFALYSALMI